MKRHIRIHLQMNEKQSYFYELYELMLKKNPATFASIMKNELSYLSRDYADKKVFISNKAEISCESSSRGGVFAFLHFGNFFLSGAALCQKLKINYTAVASLVNMQFMKDEEISFWRDVHEKAGNCYSEKLFFTSNYPKKMINWLLAGNYLGVAMDVAEEGKNNKRTEFEFLGKKVFLQTSPARLARITKKPLFPMNILYCPLSRKHKLFLGKPVIVHDEVDASKAIVEEIEKAVKGREYQFFHDIHKTFHEPSR